MITSKLVSENARHPVISTARIGNFHESNPAHQLKRMALLTLHKDGVIQYCNKIAAEFLGCEVGKNTSHSISKFIPLLTGVELIQDMQINQHLRFLSRVGFIFEVFHMDGTQFNCKLFFNECQDLGMNYLRLIVRPIIPDYLNESF